jgi:hypothetical protein
LNEVQPSLSCLFLNQFQHVLNHERSEFICDFVRVEIKGRRLSASLLADIAEGSPCMQVERVNGALFMSKLLEFLINVGGWVSV